MIAKIDKRAFVIRCFSCRNDASLRLRTTPGDVSRHGTSPWRTCPVPLNRHRRSFNCHTNHARNLRQSWRRTSRRSDDGPVHRCSDHYKRPYLPALRKHDQKVVLLERDVQLTFNAQLFVNFLTRKSHTHGASDIAVHVEQPVQLRRLTFLSNDY
jgi:hypothetical protein